MVEGFNISVTIGAKTILGRTQDDLNISAVTKTSITKDDEGEQNESVVRHDVTIRMTALLSLNSGSTTPTQLDRDDIIEQALKTGNAALVAVQYLCTGGDTYGGNAIITGYSESSSAAVDSDTTMNVDLKIIGTFAKVS